MDILYGNFFVAELECTLCLKIMSLKVDNVEKYQSNFKAGVYVWLFLRSFIHIFIYFDLLLDILTVQYQQYLLINV